MLIYSKEPLTTRGITIARGLAESFRAVGEGASYLGYTVLHIRQGVLYVVKDHIDNVPTRFTIQKGR